MSKSYSLEYAGEIRFGPSYFSLEFDGITVPGFFYGFNRCELVAGRYLAIEEWLTIDYRKGPMTRVAIFDMLDGSVARLQTVKKGFVGNFQLKDDKFSYQKSYLSPEKTEKVQVNWNTIKDWDAIYS